MRARPRKILAVSIITIAVLGLLTLLSPKLLEWSLRNKQKGSTPTQTFQQFPVTVDPRNKSITENDAVNAFLAEKHSLLGAAVSDSVDFIWGVFENVAITVANLDWYDNTASLSNRFVNISAGMRKEQVTTLFGDTLKWNNKQRKEFTASSTEGSFSPGVYEVNLGMLPSDLEAIIGQRFSDEVLSHYSTSTQAVVPLSDALTIASLIQRETLTTDGMRLLSGIMWNRLFSGMNLQIDSTLQYAKANKASTTSWWPKVTPNDKYIKSPFNTYLNKGLPPSPIASPSVAAILATLNPVKTTCLFYFNDKNGTFHCSDTYTEHKALISKYYGN